jgi:uncharacterized membrane protein HdeD (DUF308 family)
MDWSEADERRMIRWVRWILVIVGLIGVAVGIIVLAEPHNGLASLAVITGVFLLIDGIITTASSLFAGGERRVGSVVAGVVALLVGVLLIRHPVNSVVAIGLLLGLWLIVSGAVRLFEAFEVRHGRGWWLLVAVLEIAAGIVLVSSPHIAVTTLALLVGISFILRGAALAVVGWVMVEPDAESETAGGTVAAT